MSKYRSGLPQLSGELFLTDGGIETTLIFHEGLDLPHFAAFHLLQDASGRAALCRYDTHYAEIARADAATDGGPTYCMINCAHPSDFEDVLSGGGWLERLRGLRANASRRSHAELDAAPDLDAGDPVELGGQYGALRRRHPQINVLGGCCGTDHRHIEQISQSCRMAA